MVTICHNFPGITQFKYQFVLLSQSSDLYIICPILFQFWVYSGLGHELYGTDYYIVGYLLRKMEKGIYEKEMIQSGGVQASHR